MDGGGWWGIVQGVAKVSHLSDKDMHLRTSLALCSRILIEVISERIRDTFFKDFFRDILYSQQN